MKLFQAIVGVISKYLPLWILLMSIVAFIAPHLFRGIQGFTAPALSIIFLLMGMALSTESLVYVLKHPKDALIGVLIKWTITVGISIFIAYVFFSNVPEVATGIIMAGTVSSGTSANLYAFIAGGEVALSITMATLDTIIAPVLTPTLVQTFAGQFIEVAFLPLFLNIIYVVLLPIFAGLFIQWKWKEKVDVVRPYTSFVSTIALLVVVLSVVSSAQQSLANNLELLPILFFAVFFQVSVPMVAGYGLAKLIRLREENCRAILFHTGICNTALSATLAMQHVSSVAAVPSVVNMIINLTLGALVANLFAYKFRISNDVVNM
ncbi:bile acid:sodium symporter family protein [Bacillus sp. Marseille-P3661]|uniref:bile acid:sodium symporter family protein n=1 Tax=Bacillus sp. Marseille-P3661 TaxID=1936234 RepID=UPI002155B7CF|nr:bile acid:sodium symporter family protein [Bacillus sp. Marseille-P3661]